MRGLPFFLAALSWGCAIHLAPPPTDARAPASPEASGAWPKVLERFVDDRGGIAFAALRGEGGGLEEQVGYVATYGPLSSPGSFPSAESRLAYYLNAYNAWAMYLAARSGVLPRDKVKFFFRLKVLVDGRRMSLYALENRVIRTLGEPRIHFALNCMVRGCPRLPRESFFAARLESQLEAAAREFLNDERHVKVDEALREVRLSAILKWYRKDFLSQSPSLIAYVNRYRSRPIPETYRVAFLPYDWTLNEKR